MAVAHFLVIVRRERPKLLEPLRTEFAASTGTVVMLDRRARPRPPDEADPCWSSGFKVAVSSGRPAGYVAAASAPMPDRPGASCNRCSGATWPERAVVSHDGTTIHLTCWNRELRIRAAQQRERAARERDRSMRFVAAARGAVDHARQVAEVRLPR